MSTCPWNDGKPCGYWYQGKCNAAEDFVCPQRERKAKAAAKLMKEPLKRVLEKRG